MPMSCRLPEEAFGCARASSANTPTSAPDELLIYGGNPATPESTVTVMPTSYTRHRVELPRDLYQALNQAAAERGMPTSALITIWLWQTLEARCPDLHVRDPYRNGVELYDRRPRRPGELPAGPDRKRL